jgi:membrane protease YdiL (CAAX protease family)
MESFLKTTTNLSITIIFALTFVLANYNIPSNELILSTGYLLLLLGTTFYLGNQWVIQKSQIFLESKKERYLIFPIFILIIFYSFLFLHGGTPFKGSSSLHMFLFLFPTLYFLAFPTTESRWSDLMVVLLILIPSTVIKFNGNSNLPVEGSGFGSVQKFSLILGAAYSFIFVRKLKDVGFTLVLNTYNTIYSIISWLLFIGFVYIIGFIYDFNLAQPFAPLSLTLISISILELIRIYFGTALMEELFFRGWLLTELERDYTHQKALILNGFLFAVLHFLKPWGEIIRTFPQFPALFLLGTALVLAKRAHQQRLGICIGIHGGLVWSYYIFNIGHLIDYTEQVPNWVTGIDQNPLAGSMGIIFLSLLGIWMGKTKTVS